MRAIQTVENAIHRSIVCNSIVTLRDDAEVHHALLCACEDYADGPGGDVVEYWGTEDGADWRVHVRA
jgi:hypothetical protein